MKHLTLLHLYPNEMSLYGDRGNVLALFQHLRWRGVELRVLQATLGTWESQWHQADLVFMGGGQDAQQIAVVDDLHRHKAIELKALAQEAVTFLTICGGFQFLGHYYKPHHGEELRGLSLIDAYTVAGKERFIGNVVLESEFAGHPQTLVGFENHSGLTYLGAGIQPLGKVLIGKGNNGQDATEGVRHQHFWGTYLHGALLPKNPTLTQLILEQAWQRKYGESLPPLHQAEDDLAQAAHQEAVLVAKKKEER